MHVCKPMLYVWQVFASQHFACPLGGVASVAAWERVGAGIVHVARAFLRLAVLRYVDDLFGPDRCDVMSLCILLHVTRRFIVVDATL